MSLEDALAKKVSRRGFLGALGIGTAASAAVLAMPSSSNANEEGSDDLCELMPDGCAIEFIKKYKKIIFRESEEHDLPPAYLASVLYAEMANRPSFEDSGDRLKSILNADGSYGPGQIRLSTALYLDGRIKELSDMKDIDTDVKKEYIQKLNDPVENIHYTAKYLIHLKNKKNRYSFLSAEQFSQNPRAMAVIATEFNKGETNSREEEAGFSPYGYGVVIGLSSSSEIKSIFPSDAETRRVNDEFLKDNKENMLEYMKREHRLSKRDWYLVGGLSVAAAGLSFAAWGLERFFERRKHVKDDYARRVIKEGRDLKNL